MKLFGLDRMDDRDELARFLEWRREEERKKRMEAARDLPLTGE